MINTVGILFADITLGTLIDRYGDEEEAHENANKDNNNNTGAVAPLNHVLQWGLGEVGMSDVNLASAGDGTLDDIIMPPSVSITMATCTLGYCEFYESLSYLIYRFVLCSCDHCL